MHQGQTEGREREEPSEGWDGEITELDWEQRAGAGPQVDRTVVNTHEVDTPGEHSGKSKPPGIGNR